MSNNLPPEAYVRQYLGSVTFDWPFNGLEGDDVNVATANATGPFEPRNQGNRANMMGETLAIDVTTTRGWIDPLEPYGPPPTPVLASLDPPSRVVAPTDDLVLRIIGTGFLGISRIEFAGNIERTTFVSPTELTTIIRGDLFTGADPAIPVRVINAGVASNELDFAITATEPPEEPEA